ncbi:uncharacterized protein LOC126832687 [Patella vulgata]|uniref:uncharacterized protein LOC126832687 n=1 Tax=Patella vulgata TaxID=6465 RepID=UPI0021806D1C|nr:uncharacterized protein LOC126832687 [Patella vulgata]
MESPRKSPSPDDPRHSKERGSGGTLRSGSDTPDIVANTMENASAEEAGSADQGPSIKNTYATTPVCCIDSKSHHVPLPPYELVTKKNVNSYPICDIPMQYFPSDPQQQVIYANTPSNRGDNWQKTTSPGARNVGGDHPTLTQPAPGQSPVKPDDLYAKVDKTRRKDNFKPIKVQPTYENTESLTTVVVKDPKTKTTKVTTEKTSPVEAEDLPKEIPNTNIAVGFLVTMCFNIPIGAVAIFFSLMAAKSYRDGNTKLGEKRTRYAMIISLLGIVVTVLFVMGAVLYLAMSSTESKERKHAQTKSQSSFSL